VGLHRVRKEKEKEKEKERVLAALSGGVVILLLASCTPEGSLTSQERAFPERNTASAWRLEWLVGDPVVEPVAATDTPKVVNMVAVGRFAVVLAPPELVVIDIDARRIVGRSPVAPGTTLVAETGSTALFGDWNGAVWRVRVPELAFERLGSVPAPVAGVGRIGEARVAAAWDAQPDTLEARITVFGKTDVVVETPFLGNAWFTETEGRLWVGEDRGEWGGATYAVEPLGLSVSEPTLEVTGVQGFVQVGPLSALGSDFSEQGALWTPGSKDRPHLRFGGPTRDVDGPMVATRDLRGGILVLERGGVWALSADGSHAEDLGRMRLGGDRFVGAACGVSRCLAATSSWGIAVLEPPER
jgi:hypothetical protein